VRKDREAVLSRTIADMRGTAEALRNEIGAEQARTKISDPSHFAYSLAAKDMATRQSKLLLTIAVLEEQLRNLRIGRNDA
jgi:hypothetical protein